MIPFEEAWTLALSQTTAGTTTELGLDEARGRVLAQDVVADLDMPPFDKSAVDGFACRKDELDQELEIVETVAAGKMPEKKILPGTCVRIMTGAPLPEGTECVVMVEESELIAEHRVRFRIRKTAPNVCYRGEDVKTGQLLISQGTLIRPAHVAVMAAAGCARPRVYVQPTVAVMTTGDELVEPHQKPSPAGIRNSNAWQLLAQCDALGIRAKYLGIVSDDEATTLAKINQAIDQADLVLITGGVSMGDFDHVPAMMQKAGMDVLFRKIAIQPGRPTVMARKGNKICFGLPGNPVSSFVLFELLVKPVFYKMMGHDYRPATVRMQLSVDYRRKRADRMNAVPVTFLNSFEAAPAEYHGSAHIHAMTAADGLMIVSPGITEIPKGSQVDVRLLS